MTRARSQPLKRLLGTTLICAATLGCTSETRVSLLEPIQGGASSSLPDATIANGASAANPDAASTAGGSPANVGLSAHLIHRYSFEGDGTQVVDSVGHADGTLLGGAVLDGAGHAVLDGVDDFVNLPNGLVSTLTDATLIAWLSWNGGQCWQRIFDFGSTDAGEDRVGSMTTSIFATPLRCPGTGPATAFETATSLLGSVDSDVAFPVLHNLPIAVAFDVTGGELRLYRAGALLGTGTVAPLSGLSDVNNWLGRSQWPQDAHLRGTYDEFRIYDRALSAAELTAVEKAGPDAIAP